MNQDWRGALVRRLLLILLGCLLLGLVSGHLAWSLVLGLVLYLSWTLRQLLRLLAWLQQNPDAPPPASHGIWAEVFDNLYQLQRRELRQRNQLQAIIDRVQSSTAALKDGVIMLDSHGNLEWWNIAASDFLGLKHQQDTGHPITNVVRHPAFKEYFERGLYDEPLEIVSPVNDRIYLQVNITRHGNSEHMFLVRDITRLHHLEQMRKDFVANLSHELRTPLTVITGYLETLLENSGEQPGIWQRALQQMDQQAGRMQHLISDLLLLAKLETTSHPSANNPVAVDQLLKSIKSDALALSAEKQHRISLEADSHIQLRGSESELRSAFSNLVFNAVKYTPEGGDIQIRWWGNEQGAFLCVQDSGIGIDRRHLPRLTERFYRVDSSRASTTGGTGLGLAIVKHVLLRHMGRLDIDSVPGKGSAFTCHFQAAQVVRAGGWGLEAGRKE
ncbi:phosphate regulon sensor histidine kinase PhoR [Stutzerimonas kirkiae]|uniref:Phosphate regulon sensor protein PhoR n=1 Tax=Stutzerimonas kirkiae TaxID=2211392 RepID=A0A4Q9R7D0_9GAMM|nr:phosphate regulon sensor histidine kinase PhoR [Stutzerimonas kirkiae]TBU96507.1 PAS domain-containing sensor histidine kinase [Stutzerimonas kirkiae]TBV04934.1 PAS domain-containing sensor histidine kinase [Stutzerimonas kirkiae]TBV12387.1 PAS domain-containing sensor histidine kinase [Stutzerimonas kirkiae]TBV12601.1 PAS domain-containing sensor histidine kinase [Stutzerimonas kirkiae]